MRLIPTAMQRDVTVKTPKTTKIPASRYGYTGGIHAEGPVDSRNGELKPWPLAIDAAILAVSLLQPSTFGKTAARITLDMIASNRIKMTRRVIRLQLSFGPMGRREYFGRSYSVESRILI